MQDQNDNSSDAQQPPPVAPHTPPAHQPLNDQGVITNIVIHDNNSSDNDSKQSTAAQKGFIIGLLSLFAWLLPIVGFPVAIIGLVLGIKGLKTSKTKIATAAIILSILGLIATAGNAALGAYLGASKAIKEQQASTSSNSINSATPNSALETTSTQESNSNSPTNNVELAGADFNLQYNYSFRAPKNWVTDHNASAEAMVIYSSPSVISSNDVVFIPSINIVVVNLSNSNNTLDAYFQEAKIQLPKVLPEYKMLNTKDVKLDDIPAKLIYSTYEINGQPIGIMQLFAINENKAYVVTATTLNSNIDAQKDLFEASLTSIRFDW